MHISQAGGGGDYDVLPAEPVLAGIVVQGTVILCSKDIQGCKAHSSPTASGPSCPRVGLAGASVAYAMVLDPD